LFRRQAIGAGSHAINMGLVETTAGRLSGVKGDGFVSMWLRVNGESLALEFQTKSPTGTAPRTVPLSDEFITEEGKWYQFKVTFTAVSEEGIRVAGEIRKADDRGKVGSWVAGLFASLLDKDFVIQAVDRRPELWVRSSRPTVLAVPTRSTTSASRRARSRRSPSRQYLPRRPQGSHAASIAFRATSSSSGCTYRRSPSMEEHTLMTASFPETA